MNPSAEDLAAFAAFERDGWADVAGTYRDSFENVSRQAVDAVLAAIGPDLAGRRLLDVACGAGVLASAAQARGAEVVGLDAVPGMLAEARRRAPGVRFQEGDAQALPFADGRFDVVTCNFGINHFERPERAVAEAHRVLAPGGCYVFTAWCPASRSPHLALLADAVRLHGDPNVPLPKGPDGYLFGDPLRASAVLTQAGFEVMQVAEVPVVVTLREPGEVLDTILRGTVRTRAVLVAQPPHLRERIEAAAVAAAAAFRRGDRIEIPRPALLSAGRKPARLP